MQGEGVKRKKTLFSPVNDDRGVTQNVTVGTDSARDTMKLERYHSPNALAITPSFSIHVNGATLSMCVSLDKVNFAVQQPLLFANYSAFKFTHHNSSIEMRELEALHRFHEC